MVSIISPSNYPLFLGGVQVLQALVAGNAVVWKPAPGGGAVAQRLAELGAEAGLPAGLLIVLEDTVEAGAALLKEPVDKVVFTGGFANGTKVLQALSQRAIPAVLELSGCDAVFVRGDADVTLVAKALRFGLTFNQSRTCLAPRRVFVERGRAAELESAIKDAFDSMNCRLFSTSSAGKSSALSLWRAEALRRGARIVYGDTANETSDAPYVLTDVPSDLMADLGDFFSPILCIIAVDSDAEALAAAAQCEYALGASVFSTDLGAASEMALKVRAGLVTVNDLIVPSADPRIPFGGSGRSGYGVTRGAEGLLELTRIKVLQVRNGGSMAHLEPEEVSADLAMAMIRLTHGNGIWARLTGVVSLIKSGVLAWREARKSLKNKNVQ
ncbi:MAG: Acyl-CoA reductase [Verrucomicrobia bacterium]|nr:MAG: Acyl-CoA reductase [Verrucomicrobiota bacterium]